jgi:CcmD family protein
MNATHYLYAAYAATWLIHLGYLGTLVRRQRGLRERMRELKRNS